MQKRFISIWFCHLRTDWFLRRQPCLKDIPFVLSSAQHGRMVVTAANALAQTQGISIGMSVADARAILPSIQVIDDQPALSEKLLTGIAGWCIRFTPSVSTDPPDGILLEVTGCAHLWGGEAPYLKEIQQRIQAFGYDIRAGMADTIGAAWAVTRFAQGSLLIEPGGQKAAVLNLPAASLRLEGDVVERLQKLGLRQVHSFINMPRMALRRRFGSQLLQRFQQATGEEEEDVQPLHPLIPHQERLPCMEPIMHAAGIEIAIQRLLDALCSRLQKEQKGLRVATLNCYRLDGKLETVRISTNRPSCNATHLFKLFQLKIDSIEPALGIELFTMDASKVEDLKTLQEKLWEQQEGVDEVALAELLDRIAGKMGDHLIHRYLPDEHYWPERSFKLAESIHQKPATPWKLDRPRPLQLLKRPEPIEVTAPIPDYPPMLFRYKNKLHKIRKADGPERIEQEWWLQQGQHRDYYHVEDEEGRRYWLFRLGHYDVAKTYQWFMHGFFA